ncbi:hypothetical protein F8388_005512 [Cannabis sativa]|uniref:Ubiquitin-like protease family profile domain-containing protein n=1 Tax=Cannabis sativa TaxID=3483 RepID=A0A7J6GYG8_CANSA|nr:hypothetical protein F8388_005512 [Cannabis sativa]
MGKGKYVQIDDVGSQGSVDENSLSFKFAEFHRRLADISTKQEAFSAKFFILKEDFKNMIHFLKSVHKKIDMLLSRPPPKDCHDVEEYDNEEDAEIEEASHGDEDDVEDDGENEDDGNGEGDSGNDVELSIEDDDAIMAGLKAQSYVLVPYDLQSEPSANLDKVLGRPYCGCGHVKVENFVNVDEITPPIERRILKLGLHLQSLYAQQLSSSSKPTVVTSKVKGLCALQQSVVDDVNDDDEKAFHALFKSGLLKRPTKDMNGHFLYFAPADNKLEPGFDFGYEFVQRKMWFHSLLHWDQFLSDFSKHSTTTNIKITTTDCYFNSSIRSLHGKYVSMNEQMSLVHPKHQIAHFIKGKRLRCGTHWSQADHVLLLVHIKIVSHWVMGRLDMKFRIIYLYNSLRTPKYETASLLALEPYSVMFPLFFSLLGVYDELPYTLPASVNPTAPFPIVNSEVLLEQVDNDCGAFVAAFAEYFIEGKNILVDFDVEEYRLRLSVLLYKFGLMKQVENVESELESPPKPPKKTKAKARGKAKAKAK